jgi:tRNA A37 methylthiotransferase MiaB
MKTFLAMAPFWDPYCPPLGIASLQAYLKQRGHDVAIFDYNTDPQIWRPYRAYFELLQDVLPETREWNIMRLGPDYFSRHQMAWLSLRDEPRRFLELSRCILNIDGRHSLSDEALGAFTLIFETIYSRIDALTRELLAKHQPDLVGCTLLTTTLPASLHVLRRAKELNPACRTVLGGPGPIMGAGVDSPDTRRILERCPWIDNVVIGEGEVLLEALIRDRFPRRQLLSLRDVPQLSGELVPGPTTSQGLISNISELPTPDYAGLEPQRYTNLSVGVSRGCAYKCSFCYETTYWKRYRKRPIDSALRDLKTLRERYDRTHFFLCDSLANFFADDLSKALLDAGLDIKWDAYLRADSELLDPEYVAQLADGGMVRARLGLESADEGTLELMNKKMSVDRMGKVLENLAEEGIQTSTLWIVGFPEEDERAFQESLDFLVEFKDAIYCADPWQFVFHPTTGTEPVFGRLVASESFETRYGMRRLYPEEFDDALLVQYFELDIPDVVPMKIDRIRRMCRVMEEAGIPNPYTLREWRAANRRWDELHPKRTASVAVSVPDDVRHID